jgi:hypothetical protein
VAEAPDPAAHPGDDVPAIARDAGSAFAEGDRVVHPHFGEGRLVSTYGAGANRRLVVRFDRHGTKTMTYDRARLSRAPASPPGGP